MNINRLAQFISLLFLACCPYLTHAQPMPGGVNNPNYTWGAWLTPDSYNPSTGTWVNLITTPNTAGDFYSPQATPSKVNSGYNFHPSVKFTNPQTVSNSATQRLLSRNIFPIIAGQNVTVITVLRKTNNTKARQNIISFDNTANNLNIRYASNDLYAYWTALRNLGNDRREGIISISMSNDRLTTTNYGGIVHSRNGLRAWFAGGTATTWQGSANFPIAIATETQGSYYGFDGPIQEMIVVRAQGPNNHMDAGHHQKILSYLAVKYGLSLNNNDNYLASDSTVTWDRMANIGYNNHIFGIGRDDATGLYQKQAQSESSRSLTAFVGSSITTLNSENNGTLSDKQFLLFGTDGGRSIRQLTGINNNDPFQNGNVISTTGEFNIQSHVYKTQLTGPNSMQVKLRANSNDYLYALVSTGEDFNPLNTWIYPVNNRIAEVEINLTYKYIKFIGFASGPGGVNSGLVLWLRADDDASLDIEYRPSADITATTNLLNYPGRITPGDDVPAVAGWSDLIRNKDYTYAAGAGDANHRIPVLETSSPETNFHPAVRFWASGNTYSSYLSNNQGILSTGMPPEGRHHAFFLVNNNFGSNRWVYALGFGGTSSVGGPGGVPRPGYGVEQGTSANRPIYGRFRTGGGVWDGNLDLFKPGSTSILGYMTNTNTVTYRFNAKEEINTGNSWGTTNLMNGYSTLGTSYDHNRCIIGVMSEVIMFNRNLPPAEVELIESYMALKYGITLSPSNTTYNRFSYKFSNGQIIWDGNTDITNKFAIFYNNVAAVIRDDAARLNNRHAHSTNNGSLLHLGAAGTELSEDGSKVGELNNMEAVVFGSNSETGFIHLASLHTMPCGDFDAYFKRKWLIHKVANRPITMLVGAEDNQNLTIGDDDYVKLNYYNKLGAAYSVFMLVASSPADLDAGNFVAVVPMTYLNGRQQCSYTFTAAETYITFGYRLNDADCVEETPVRFTETKKFNWSEWTRQTNPSNATNLTITPTHNPDPNFDSCDLGDGLVVSTNIKYPNTVRATVGYPRSVNSPEAGSLEVRRQNTSITTQDVEITINFTYPVIPSFTISGLDRSGNSLEEVEIIGTCKSTTVPTLSYAQTLNSRTSYRIRNNVAAVQRGSASMSASNRNGMVNVTFRGGVTSVKIKYRTRVANTTAMQRIFISPIRIRPIPPPPPVNEDGLSFVKGVEEPMNMTITTCESVRYLFEIQNTNNADKYVNFTDILPSNMKWEIESLALDTINTLHNSQIQINNYGGTNTLQIDNLLVPCASKIRFMATALMDENAPSGYYSNYATIVYEILENSLPVTQTLHSVDEMSLEPLTTIYAEYQPRQETVMVEAEAPIMYMEDEEVEVTLKINNPNTTIMTDMYLDIAWNENFTYVPGSLVTSGNISVAAVVSGTQPDVLIIAGNAGGSAGFTINPGISYITFKIKAPSLATLKDELDEHDLPTGRKESLSIFYDFSTEMNDPCVALSMRDMSGELNIPHFDIDGVTFTVNGEDRVDMDGKAYCNTSDFVLKIVPETVTYTSIEWKLNGTVISGSANQKTVNLIGLPNGYYTISMTFYILSETRTLTTNFYVGTGALVWTPEANPGSDKNNWDNPANWTPAFVPTSCYNVFIPGNSTHYPMLASIAVCNNIYFMQGGELGRPDLLTYNEVRVQYNFGLARTSQITTHNDRDLVLKSNATADRMLYAAAVSIPLSRERWYMLSAPLRSVVSGDYAFGGFPLTFMRKFGPIIKEGIHYPVGNWTNTYNSYVETIAPTEGFAFFMLGSPGQGSYESGLFNDMNDLYYLSASLTGQKYGILETNGILELPFFDDPISLRARRTQTYNPATQESVFYHIADGTRPEGFNYFTGGKDVFVRESLNKGSYRFTPEVNVSGQWNFQPTLNHPVSGLSSGDKFLVGNPYMSSLNIVEFMKDNVSSVEPQFDIWDSSGFVQYSVNTTTGAVTPTDPGASPYIAPLQSFILTYKTGNVVFDVTKISTVRPANAPFNLRSSARTGEANILRIKAANSMAESYALIGNQEEASGSKNVPKLFSPFNYVPEVYTLAGEIPAGIQYIDNNSETVIPLGIKTNQSGNTTFTFTGMDRYNKTSKIVFTDMLLNKEIILTGYSDISYSFDNQTTGIQNDRFFLRFGASPTSLSLPQNADDIQIYANESGILVKTPDSDPICLIQVYDLMGRKIFEETLSGVNMYQLSGNYKARFVIVNVHTNNRVKSQTIMIRN